MGNYIKNVKINRTKHDDLCQAKFKPNDIILSSTCCHNFHWEYNNDTFWI
jgi:hypothetical protein